MCIVSIFSDNQENFILTHNRDETILRPSSDEIQTREIFNRNFTGPVDLVSGGTWIYHSENYAVCILNGAYEKHEHRPSYRMSRGLVILELLKYNLMDEFIEEVNLEGVEPFTMIMLNRNSNEKKILVWDEIQKYKEDVSGEKLIVRSSAPLYSVEERNNHFHSFEKLIHPNSTSIFQLQDELKMLKNNKFLTVQTTSITQIIQNNSKINLKFCPIGNSN